MMEVYREGMWEELASAFLLCCNRLFPVGLLTFFMHVLFSGIQDYSAVGWLWVSLNSLILLNVVNNGRLLLTGMDSPPAAAC